MDIKQKREQQKVFSAVRAAQGYSSFAVQKMLAKRANELKDKYRKKYGVAYDAKPVKVKAPTTRSFVAKHMHGKGGAHEMRKGKKVKRSRAKANWKKEL